MKRIVLSLLAALCVAGLLSSCSDDDEVRLNISNLVVGEANSKTVAVSNDTLYVSAALIADAGIQNVRITMTPVDDELTVWDYNALFVSGYSALKVTTFEELIPIQDGPARVLMYLRSRLPTIPGIRFCRNQP